MKTQLFTARYLLATPERGFDGGGLLVRGGRVERLLETHGEVRRASQEHERVDLGDCILHAGLINAHAHLELTGLAGRVRPEGSFAAWIGSVVGLRRAETDEGLVQAVHQGARRALATGTTALGDIDSCGVSERELSSGPLRARVYREALDAADPERTQATLDTVRRSVAPVSVDSPVDTSAGEPAVGVGLSPHSPYTVSAALWTALGELARENRWPVSVHFAETEEEQDWLRAGSGPFGSLPLGTPPTRDGPPAEARSALDVIDAAGLLGPRTSLVHANLALPTELRRVAEAGATLVHCPGTHAFFDRGEAPLAAFRSAGCRVALGTDSLASNDDLDLFRELVLLRRASPWIAPAEAWAMATRNGARPLALEAVTGELTPGSAADFCASGPVPGDGGAVGPGGGEVQRESVLEALTSAACRPRQVWIGGQPVARLDAADDRPPVAGGEGHG